jgi:hypothetical protein
VCLERRGPTYHSETAPLDHWKCILAVCISTKQSSRKKRFTPFTCRGSGFSMATNCSVAAVYNNMGLMLLVTFLLILSLEGSL